MFRFVALLFFTHTLFAYTIVFIHIGPELPDYLICAVEQARLFNPDCDLCLITDPHVTLSSRFTDLNVRQVTTQSLMTSTAHQRFKILSRLDKRSLNGFWFFTSERFFYLEEWMRREHLTDVFHLENDVLVYVNLNELLPVFHEHYNNFIGATFEDDGRCVPGFFYVSTLEPLTQLCEFFTNRAQQMRNEESDMIVIGEFKRAFHKKWIDDLPVIFPTYPCRYPLQRSVNDPLQYANLFEEFDSIFDGACIGQYLGGFSPVHLGHSIPGYVDPYCFFSVSDFEFEWKEDIEGRKIPYILFEGMKKRINNLHIHCKNLKKFSSIEK